MEEQERLIIVSITYQNHFRVSWGKLCLITCCLKRIVFFSCESLKFITIKKRFVICIICFIIFSHPLCSLFSVCLLSTLNRHCTVLNLWMSPKDFFKETCIESLAKILASSHQFNIILLWHFSFSKHTWLNIGISDSIMIWEFKIWSSYLCLSQNTKVS